MGVPLGLPAPSTDRGALSLPNHHARHSPYAATWRTYCISPQDVCVRMRGCVQASEHPRFSILDSRFRFPIADSSQGAALDSEMMQRCRYSDEQQQNASTLDSGIRIVDRTCPHTRAQPAEAGTDGCRIQMQIQDTRYKNQTPRAILSAPPSLKCEASRASRVWAWRFSKTWYRCLSALSRRAPSKSIILASLPVLLVLGQS
ncbi:hypothetical protein GY45DRAFT_728176 [Cubamyces sp. BRFM 1775]|nr:hypothetical protein GY45DRAFT_728176 [Cubamyces sp. BRFM 1775]